MRKLLLVTVVVTLLLAYSGLVEAGTLTGEVTYVGEVPKLVALKPTTDQFCVSHTKGHVDDLVVSQATGIQNVVVSLLRVQGEFKPPEEGPTLDQVNCIYTPHVLAVLDGTTVNIKSSDSTIHNVHMHAQKNEEVNWGMPIKDMKLPYKTSGVEPIKLTCDVHNWMSAYIVVLDNPYFAVVGTKDADAKPISAEAFRASQSKGNYRIEKIPAGTYRVQAWHETLGVAVEKVEIAATGEVKLNFTSAQFKKRGAK